MGSEFFVVAIFDPTAGHLRRQQRTRTVFERVRDMLSTCLRPARARHAGLRPGFRPARLMEFGF